LLVEDNPDDELLMLQAFKKHNILNEVTLIHDGQEALDYLLASQKPLPAVMLLDLKLPKVAGLEVLRRVRADLPRANFHRHLQAGGDAGGDRCRCADGQRH